MTETNVVAEYDVGNMCPTPFCNFNAEPVV